MKFRVHELPLCGSINHYHSDGVVLNDSHLGSSGLQLHPFESGHSDWWSVVGHNNGPCPTRNLDFEQFVANLWIVNQVFSWHLETAPFTKSKGNWIGMNCSVLFGLDGCGVILSGNGFVQWMNWTWNVSQWTLWCHLHARIQSMLEPHLQFCFLPKSTSDAHNFVVVDFTVLFFLWHWQLKWSTIHVNFAHDWTKLTCGFSIRHSWNWCVDSAWNCWCHTEFQKRPWATHIQWVVPKQWWQCNIIGQWQLLAFSVSLLDISGWMWRWQKP